MPEKIAIAPRPVDTRIARSWLLVNGTRTDLFDPADRSCADQIVLDIEDAVDAQLKSDAREEVAAWLEHARPGCGSTTGPRCTGAMTSIASPGFPDWRG